MSVSYWLPLVSVAPERWVRVRGALVTGRIDRIRVPCAGRCGEGEAGPSSGICTGNPGGENVRGIF